MDACIHAYTGMNACMYACIHPSINVCMHACMPVYVCACTHVCAHTHKHTRAHTHAFVLEVPRAPLQADTPKQSVKIFLSSIADGEQESTEQLEAAREAAHQAPGFRPFGVAVLNVACLRRHPLVHRLRAFVETNSLSLDMLFARLMQGAESEDLAQGLLTEMQLWDAAKRIGLRMTTGELSQLFAELDLNTDGFVHFSEFAAVLRTAHAFLLPARPLRANAHSQDDAGCANSTSKRQSAAAPLGWLCLHADLSDNNTEAWSDGYGCCAALQNALSRAGDASLILPPFSPHASSSDSRAFAGKTAAQTAATATAASRADGFTGVGFADGSRGMYNSITSSLPNSITSSLPRPPPPPASEALRRLRARRVAAGKGLGFTLLNPPPPAPPPLHERTCLDTVFPQVRVCLMPRRRERGWMRGSPCEARAGAGEVKGGMRGDIRHLQN